MAGAVEAAVFATRPANLIGPIKTEQGWNLFKVTKIYRPTLAESAGRIRLDLMQQLIDKLIAEAAIAYPVPAGRGRRHRPDPIHVLARGVGSDACSVVERLFH